MNISEKPPVKRPRVFQGPHRLRLSGAASEAPVAVEDVVTVITVGDSEFVSSPVELPAEVVEPTTPGQ
jgi:hypothetical protein